MASATFNSEINLIGLNRAQLLFTGTEDCSNVQISVSESVALDERATLAETKDKIRKAAKLLLAQAAASL